MSDWLPDLLRVLVENGNDTKAARFEFLIIGDSGAEGAGADENNRPDRVDVEDFLKLPAEEFDVISGALLAEFAEVAQVLANLRGADAQVLAQFLAGGYLAPFISEEAQGTQIDRKSSDNDVGNGGFRLRSFVLHRFMLSLSRVEEGRIGSVCWRLSRPSGTEVRLATGRAGRRAHV